MAVCSKCGGELNPKERFCGNCGLDTQAAAQQTVPQQVVYVPPTVQTAPGQRCGCTARAAMGLGIGGGLLGIIWGALGPYLSLKLPERIGWFYGPNPYLTGIEPLILMIIGLAVSVLAILGATLATKAVGVTRVVLVICGLVGFVIGPSWLIPGTLILAAAGLAIAAKPQH
jgi:hypothetical protein